MTDFYPLDSNVVTQPVIDAMWKVLKKHGVAEIPYDGSDDMKDDLACLWTTAEDLLVYAARVARPAKEPELPVMVINTVEERGEKANACA